MRALCPDSVSKCEDKKESVAEDRPLTWTVFGEFTEGHMCLAQTARKESVKRQRK